MPFGFDGKGTGGISLQKVQDAIRLCIVSRSLIVAPAETSRPAPQPGPRTPHPRQPGPRGALAGGEPTPSQRNVGLATAILQVCIHCLGGKSVRTPSGVIILLWTTASPWGLSLARTRPGRHPQPPLTPPARSASAGLPTAEPISRVHPAARRSTAPAVLAVESSPGLDFLSHT